MLLTYLKFVCWVKGYQAYLSTLVNNSHHGVNNYISHRLLVVIVSSLTACQPAPSTDKKAPIASDKVLTVYTSLEPKQLEKLLASYPLATTHRLVIVSDEPMGLLARLKAEGTNSPADLMLMEDSTVWQLAADDELLMQLPPQVRSLTNKNSPYQQMQGLWLPLSLYGRTAIVDGRQVSAEQVAQLTNYNDLAKPLWRKKICLSQASYPPNQALIASVLAKQDEKSAQTSLQGWLDNLAMPVLLDDTAVIKAIEKEQCQIGMVDSPHFFAYSKAQPQTPLRLLWLKQKNAGTVTNITAAAIPKSAKHPQQAAAMLTWLTQKPQYEQYLAMTATYPLEPTKSDVNTSADASLSTKVTDYLADKTREFKPSRLAIDNDETNGRLARIKQAVDYP